MEDLKTASNRLVLSSVGLILLLGGWASFADSIPVGFTGLKLTSFYVAPYLLGAFWLYSWQRYFVLSRHINRPEIDKILVQDISLSPNSFPQHIVRRVFPPHKYGYKGEVAILRWGWPHADIPNNASRDFILYKRSFLKRSFWFQYMGSDKDGNAFFTHYGDKAINICSGSVAFLSVGYWICLSYEIAKLSKRSFSLPVIGAHYFPHMFAWGCFSYITIWLIKLFINMV